MRACIRKEMLRRRRSNQRRRLLLEESAAPTTDEYWDNVSFLVNFDGFDDDATEIGNELSDNAIDLNMTGGDVVDTDVSKWGTGSLKKPGVNGAATATGTYSALNLGSGDFTVEFWVRFNNYLGTQQMFVAKYYDTGNEREWWVGTTSDASSIYFAYSTNGSNGIVGPTAAWSPNDDQWYHIAASRSGNNMYLFIDGALVDTYDATGVTLYASDSPFVLGARRASSGVYQYVIDGWLDDVRVTKGVCRYTDSFSVPTAAYPTSGP